MKDAEIDALVKELMSRTTWYAAGLPCASTFHVAPKDLKIIQPYFGWDYDGTQLIAVRHRNCRGEVKFDLNEQDPIMSEYSCDGLAQDGWTYCDWTWKAVDVAKMSHTDLQHHFYTELLEDANDLVDWPIKLCEIDNGAIRYSSTRPCTKEEILRTRVKRLLTVRGVK